MIRYGIVLLENSCQRHRSGKNRTSLIGSFSPSITWLTSMPSKKAPVHPFVWELFNKNTVSVKINIAVQIRNAAYRLLFPDTDADTVVRKPVI